MKVINNLNFERSIINDLNFELLITFKWHLSQ
jgi:hypothetical protein